MALPWLESLPVWGAEPTPPRRAEAARDSVHGQRRQSHEWWARGSGADIELGRSLAPMEPLKGSSTTSRAVQQSGHRRRHSSGNDGNLLSGAPLTKGAALHGGVSLDQVLASHIGVRRCNRAWSWDASSRSPATTRRTSRWRTARTSRGRARRRRCRWRSIPSLAFDSLFENRGSQRNLSVLDRVQGAGRVARRQVSSADKGKLDEYPHQRSRRREARAGHARRERQG
jgi:hypothetical protein